MAIPESQLSKWSDHGPQDASKRTHEAIRQALAAHQWPGGVRYDVYLQGSYSNDTNLQGDSDVDVVVELTSTVINDTSALSQHEREFVSASFHSPGYRWNDFRREVLKVLQGKFGTRTVGQGNKSIKVKGDSGRLAADVVVCTGHRRHIGYFSSVEGITFQALQDKRRIVSYPKQHRENGVAKNVRTWDRYKRTVRMFKSARNRLVSSGRIRADLASSYFIECLVYNAPDEAFQTSRQETYCAIVNWMIRSKLGKLPCQNGQQRLFGRSPDQWRVRDAKEFANRLADLWNNWS